MVPVRTEFHYHGVCRNAGDLCFVELKWGRKLDIEKSTLNNRYGYKSPLILDWNRIVIFHTK